MHIESILADALHAQLDVGSACDWVREHRPSGVTADLYDERATEPVDSHATGWLVDGLPTGVWIYDYREMWSMATMHEGRPCGLVVTFSADGTPLEMGVENADGRDGLWTTFTDGVPSSMQEFELGEATGMTVLLHSNGLVRLYGVTDATGSWQGEVEEHDEHGRLIGRGPMSPDSTSRTGVWTIYENGIPVSQAYLQNDDVMGDWTPLDQHS